MIRCWWLGTCVAAALAALVDRGAAEPTAPGILFNEGFDDANVVQRGWYDNAKVRISAKDAHAGGGCIEYEWEDGGKAVGSRALRHLFTPTEVVHIRFYIKLSKGWGWSGRDYHPHMLNFLTTENSKFHGPASSHLTLYIEANGGKLRLGATDMQNSGSRHGLTQGPLRGGYNGKLYDSDKPLLTDANWHCVEAMFKLNSADAKNDKWNADGQFRGWVDGKLVVERTDVIFRTSDWPNMKINQFLLAPYFAPGLLPHAQKLWIDELAVGTERIGPLATRQSARPAPAEGSAFAGRIAWSADGNFNDEDDWAASPVALAILARAGAKDKLVHFDYNCILSATDPNWEKVHERSVLGAAEKFGFPKAVFHDCRKDLDAAVSSIARAIDDSSAADPLYFVLAGPMDVPIRGIEKSDPARRRFVWCISHSRWNDGYATKFKHTSTKRQVIALGVHWVQIADQNRLLSTSPYGRDARPEEWAPWHWMRDSADADVRFLWDRMLVSTRPDCSDAGMAYFLATGDQEVSPAKLRQLIEDRKVPQPLGARKQVRLETENFPTLDGYEVEDRGNRQASHGLSVRLAGGERGRIAARFDEPYVAPVGRFDVDVRYFGEAGGRCELALSVNGKRQGAAWLAAADKQTWLTRTIPNVTVRRGDEIAVEARGGVAGAARLDYVQLNDEDDDGGERK